MRGHATLDETRTPEPGQEPIHLAGDLLTLRGGTTPDAKIEVVGQPAELGGRGMSLVSGTVHMHRGQNRAWIDGPGEATLPVPEDQSLSLTPPGAAAPVREPVGPLPFGAAPPAPPKKMHVVWQDGLVFDGQTVHLEGDVRARTPTQLALCRTLDAKLSRPIDFNAPNSRERMELGRLHLDGGVLLKNYTDERGQ